jgi:hypothetical protein
LRLRDSGTSGIVISVMGDLHFHYYKKFLVKRK